MGFDFRRSGLHCFFGGGNLVPRVLSLPGGRKRGDPENEVAGKERERFSRTAAGNRGWVGTSCIWAYIALKCTYAYKCGTEMYGDIYIVPKCSFM